MVGVQILGTFIDQYCGCIQLLLYSAVNKLLPVMDIIELLCVQRAGR